MKIELNSWLFGMEVPYYQNVVTTRFIYTLESFPDTKNSFSPSSLISYCEETPQRVKLQTKTKNDAAPEACKCMVVLEVCVLYIKLFFCLNTVLGKLSLKNGR